ncbi:MAG: OmpW family outer membrane protein [Ketobacteraceae bacterium]|nr:OmpW family outer membrane protein [Ketobacteraceae bacterium]
MKTLTKNLVAPFAVSVLALGVGQAMAYEAGDVVVRGGYASVNPDVSSDNVLDPAVVGGADNTVDVDDGTAAGISLTYMLGANLGLEILAATPFTHDIEGADALDGVDIGETKHLPPTVSLQYNFPIENQINLYAGIGINYTTFFSEETTTELNTTLSTVLTAATGSTVTVTDTDLKLKDSWGLAVSAGVDYQIDDKWGINAGLYWIDIDTEAKVAVNGATATRFDVEIDPMVYRLNVVYKL